MLGAAVDFIIEEQREFLKAWAAEVTQAELSLDGDNWHGIHKRQASRWRKALKDADAYRKRLYGVEYAAAMGLKSRGAAKRAIKEAVRRRLPRGDCTLGRARSCCDKCRKVCAKCRAI